MIISSVNNLDVNAPVTYLSNAEVAGTTVVRVKNSTGLTTSWAVQLGKTGEQFTEVVIGTPTNIGTLGVATTNFAHPSNTPVYFTKFNQVVFERSTAGTAGTASPITAGTIGYQADSQYTIFDDTSGTPAYAYKTYFRSSVLAVNSIESDWITSTGFDFYSLAAIRQRVKDKLWISSFVTDSQVDSWINEHLETMSNKAIRVNEDYLIGTAAVGFGTNELGTITDTRFKQLRRVWVTYDGNSNFQATKMAINEYQPDEQFTTTRPYFYQQGDTVFGIRPANNGGTATLAYYQNASILQNDTDTLPISMRAYSKSFVNYSLAQALFKDGKSQEAGAKLGEVDADVQTFLTEIAPRAKTGPTYIRIKEVTTGEDWGP